MYASVDRNEENCDLRCDQVAKRPRSFGPHLERHFNIISKRYICVC